ncbi:MAG TPA: hypothetical protein VFJ74_14335 [Gemmatimonadaceae bacterium]|nr:hypothetical protein [Gemmatimonadaceae bacterium]
MSARPPMLRALRCLSTIAALGCAAVAAAPAPARAQQQQQSATSFPPRIQPAARATLERLADSARAGGLPDGPLYAKAAEGVLKGATDDRIVAAVRALAREMEGARVALGGDASAAELVAGASALHAGVATDVLRRLANERRASGGAASSSRSAGATRSLAMPLVVLADLVTRGVPAGAAASSIDALVARGVSDVGLAALRRDVERDILGGNAPQAAAAARTRALVDGLDAAAAAGRPSVTPRTSRPPTP